MTAFLLAAVMVVSICGCSSDEEISYGRTTLAYEQTQRLHTAFDTVAIMHHKLKEGCREKLNLMFVVSKGNENLEQNQILVNDLYMLDLDTGKWFVDSIINTVDEPGFETKERAFAYFYNLFDSVRAGDTTWPESVRLDYLSKEEVSRVSQMWEQHVGGKVRKQHSGKADALPVHENRQEELKAVLDQPAGIARSTVSSIEEAVTFLGFRFSSLPAGDLAGDISGATSITLRSGVEILEDHRQPASQYDIATCVTYLLSDTYEIDTLVVLLTDGSPMAINMIKTADGYWFFDPVVFMNDTTAAFAGMQLPELKCDGADTYVESLKENSDFFSKTECIFKVPNGARLDLKFTDADGCVIVNGAAEQLYCKPTD